MFIDHPDSHYPLVIVGSGPAGMTLAHDLVNTHGSDRILMIESGAMEYDPEINKLSLVNATGDLESEYYAAHSVRAFGGTSMVWAGLCSVIESLSFKQGRWPFDHETLIPYYQRAALVLGLPVDATEKYEQPVNADSSLHYRPFYLSEPVRFGSRYREFAEQSGALSVLLSTTVREISHDGERVTGVQIQTKDGSTVSIGADKVVLACGGIGNPRLLLLSGLDVDGRVGKNFMEHTHVYSYNDVLLGGDAVSSTFSVSGDRANAFSLSEKLLMEKGLNSFTISTGPKEDDGLAPNSGPGTIRARMTIQAEVLPHENNRVWLSNEHDALGQPRAAINFEFNAEESLAAQWRLAGETVLRENLGRFAAPAEARDMTGGGHLMGTTAMGPVGEGCVNEDGELHSCRSLFVAGSSVFPAGGAANPTFTIVALALKLSDHLAGMPA